MIRIIIADDHAILRDGLKRIIEAASGCAVVAEAVNANQVTDQVRKQVADVLLLDLSMPGASGIDLIRHVKNIAPKLSVLVLSMHAEEQYALRAIRAGACGYLTKDCAAEGLVRAIRKVAGGGVYISEGVAEQLARHLNIGAIDDVPHRALSDREYEVFLALVAGRGVSDIAQRMHLSVKTVSTHKRRILEKMHLDSVADLVRYAVAHRLIDLPYHAEAAE
ncbi:MAG TPA: response regulator transcription factor [Burkholderiales bacterium]|jgi:Response regulator containing a CheY-like receiver domain and an HTH DNA-binding domain